MGRTRTKIRFKVSNLRGFQPKSAKITQTPKGTVSHSVSKTEALSFLKGIQKNAAGTLTPFTDHTCMCSFVNIKSELHLYLKLRIRTENLNGIFVLALSVTQYRVVPSQPPGWLYIQNMSPHSKHSPTSLSTQPHKHSRAIHFSTGSSTS